MKTTYSGRRAQLEDNLKYQKWNISATTGRIFPKFYTCMTKAKQMKTTYSGRQVQLEDNLKYQKWNISATTGWIFPKCYT